MQWKSIGCLVTSKCRFGRLAPEELDTYPFKSIETKDLNLKESEQLEELVPLIM